MAVVKPLFVDSGNLKEMDSTKVNEIVDQCVYQYSLSPSVALSVVSSGGSLSAINDTRKSAGAQSTSASGFPSEGTTQEPQTVTVSYDKVTETRTAGSPTADTGKTWPVYYNSSGQIQAMSLTDVKDTFLHPAIDLLASGSTGTQQGGTYHVSTSASVSGSTEVSGSSTANTNIRATVSGTILEIPVKLGDQVIAANNFNAGTSVAIIADLNKMIFEGQVDEAEVGKLEIGQELKINMAAIPDREFDAKLKFVAPKGTEQGGAVQFKIEADVTLDEDSFVRAGYSANGSLVVDNRQDIMVIAEALLQFDRRTQQPFVEIEISDQNFERKDIEIGLSDGIKVEIISGIEMTDKIKIWNKTEPIKIEPEESAFDQFRED